MNDILRYANQGATRNQPIKSELEAAIRMGVLATYGDGYRVDIISGGQTNDRRVGKTIRHDHGHAADVYIYGPDGKRLEGDSLLPIAQHWQSQGLGGVGFPAKSGQSLHLDLVGGKGPGSRPTQGKEGMLWYYGTPSSSQKRALTSGVTPQYKIPYEQVAKGLVPPKNVPGGDEYAVLTALDTVAPEPKNRITAIRARTNALLDSTSASYEPKVAPQPASVRDRVKARTGDTQKVAPTPMDRIERINQQLATGAPTPAGVDQKARAYEKAAEPKLRLAELAPSNGVPAILPALPPAGSGRSIMDGRSSIKDINTQREEQMLNRKLTTGSKSSQVAAAVNAMFDAADTTRAKAAQSTRDPMFAPQPASTDLRDLARVSAMERAGIFGEQGDGAGPNRIASIGLKSTEMNGSGATTRKSSGSGSKTGTASLSSGSSSSSGGQKKASQNQGIDLGGMFSSFGKQVDSAMKSIFVGAGSGMSEAERSERKQTGNTSGLKPGDRSYDFDTNSWNIK